MLRRLRRRMPNQETEMNAVDLKENSAEGAASDAAASETSTVPQGGAAAESGPIPVDGPADSVSRAEYDQLKAERDQLVDRLARLQAEFENARKRAEREKAEYRDYAAASIVGQ